MGEIVLVAFIEQDKEKATLSHIHVISKQHNKSHLDTICDRNSKTFDKLILRPKKEDV